MKNLVALSLALTIGACAARSSIEPVGAGRTRYNVSVGGPLVSAFDTYVPIPNLTAGANHGLTDRLDLSGSLSLLSLFYGLASIDVGATWYPFVDTSAATVALQPRLMTFVSFKSGVDDRLRAYPAVSASAAWRRGDDRFYAGFDLTVPVSSPDFDDDPPPVVFSPMIGYHWSLRPSMRLLTEIKWVGVNVRTNATAEYVHPFGYGAIAPFIGLELGM